MSRYINADALIKRIQDEHKFGSLMLSNMIADMQTADVVEVKHGKWIPRTNLPKQEIFICSVCGGWAYSPWIGSRKKPKPNWCKYKYCPNCGADMEVEE